MAVEIDLVVVEMVVVPNRMVVVPFDCTGCSLVDLGIDQLKIQ